MGLVIGIIATAIGMYFFTKILPWLNSPMGEQEMTEKEKYEKERDILMYDALHIKLDERKEFYDRLDKFKNDFKEMIDCTENDYRFIWGLANRTINNELKNGKIPLTEYQLI